MPFDRGGRRVKQLDTPTFSRCARQVGAEMEFVPGVLKVLSRTPGLTLVRVSLSRPTPECPEKLVVNGSEHSFADPMPVELCPPFQFGIEECDEVKGGTVQMGLYLSFQLLHKSLHILSCRFDEQFSFVFADIEPQKVKASLDVTDVSFGGGEGQTTFLQETLEAGGDFLLQKGTVLGGDDEVVGVADDVDFGLFALLAGETGCYRLFQSIQGHVGKSG